MTYHLDIVTQESDWDRLFSQLPDPSARGAHRYLAASARIMNNATAEAAILSKGDEFIIHPYVKRQTPFAENLFDLVSPYDFGSFWWNCRPRETQIELFAEFEETFARHAASANIVCEFVRLDPYCTAAEFPLRRYERRLQQNNIIIALDRSHADIRRGYSQSRRNQVLQGIRNGLTLEFSNNPKEFIEVYHASMDRHAADQDYYFPLSYIEELRDRLIVTYVRTPEGALCGAHVFLIENDVIYLYLSASVPEKQRLRPNDFGYDAIIDYAIGRGLKYFHLGGGAESLIRYKRSFSPATVPYYHLRQIFKLEQYAALSQIHDETFPGQQAGNFFPHYRQGLRAGASGRVPAVSIS